MQHIIGVFGQSNAVGFGELSQVPIFQNAARMFEFGNDYVLKQAVEPLDSSVDQVDFISDDGTKPKAGFAMPMANILLDSLSEGDTIILVPCAKSSTYISNWGKDWAKEADEDTLFCSAIRRMWAAYDAAILNGPAKFSACVLWIGETDAQTASNSAAFMAKTGRFVADVRADLLVPEMPFGIARLNSLMIGNSGKPSWVGIRTRLTQSEIRNMVVVETEGAEFQADKVHATTAGYQVIGARFATALQPFFA